MCTARSSSRPRGGLPQCMLGYTPPLPRCGPGDPPCCKACWDTTCNACWDTTPSPPCGQTRVPTFLDWQNSLTFPAYTFYSIHTPPFPGVGLDTPCCKACWDTTAMHAGIPPPPPLWTDQGSHFSGLTKFPDFSSIFLPFSSIFLMVYFF